MNTHLFVSLSILPVWVEMLCELILIVFVVMAIRAVYINLLKDIFSRRHVVKAELVSKVEEEYHELAYGTASSKSPGLVCPGKENYFRPKNRTAYRLYFDAAGKKIELDVTKEIFDSLKEGDYGTLDYKGNYYNDFKVETTVETV